MFQMAYLKKNIELSRVYILYKVSPYKIFVYSLLVNSCFATTYMYILTLLHDWNFIHIGCKEYVTLGKCVSRDSTGEFLLVSQNNTTFMEPSYRTQG